MKEEFVKDVKKAIETNKLLIGLNSVEKNLRRKNLKKLFFANNASKKDKDRLINLCESFDCDYEELDIDNINLGYVCKKRFSVAFIGFLD
jgi:ribosomal protein L30E